MLAHCQAIAATLRRFVSWRRTAQVLLLVLAAAMVWATLTPGGRTTAKSGMFVANLIPGFPVRPLNWFTRDPERIEVTFSDGTETWSGTLYMPATSPPHPGIVVALGVTPAGREDRRVQRLGDGLARMGIAALIPYDEDLIRKRVTPREVDFMVNAYQYLRDRHEVDPERVGFLGVCVGSSLSLLAAQDPRIAAEVDFVSWFGGYYRLDDLIASVVTESFPVEGEVRAWEPDRLTKEVVRLRVLDFVQDEAERSHVRDRVLHGTALPDGLTLSATGELVLELFEASSFEEAHTLLGRFPPEARRLIDRLSPANNQGRLHARLYLMDDTSDRLIPYVHTRELAGELADSVEKHSRFSVFSHVDLKVVANPIRTVPDLWRLFRHIDSIMQGIR